jgi:membrane protein DedA with SNARE-associated domain
VGWVERHPILAVFLPAILPPPIPLSPFILASGALGIPRKSFLLTFGAARILRYSLVAWLAVVYGRNIVRMWAGTLEKWSTPLLWVFAAVVVSGVCMGVVKLRGHQGPAQGHASEAAAARAD